MEESEDKEATIGAGACEGERRRIMMNHDTAYGEAGAFRLIPPRVSSALVTRLIMMM